MSAFVNAVLGGLNIVRNTAVRLVLGLLVALCALTLAAVPATAQTITGATASTPTFSGSGQTITFTVSVNSGNKVASSATVVSNIGAVYSCPIADTANTGVNFTCTATYTTTAGDVSSTFVQERATVTLLSFATPTIMVGPILTVNYVAPASPPTVTGISPSTGPNSGGTAVTINGTNFSGTTAVTFGATAATGFTVNSASQITATAPAGTNTVDVRVTTSSGTSPVSAADQFTYISAPSVTGISPTTGPAAGGTAVTINGTGFAGTTAVNFGATPATGFTVNSATQITATSPAGTGTINVRVTTGGGTSAAGPANQFTYAAANVAPVITGNPSNLTVNSGATATFTAAASGTPTPTIQWQVDSGAGFTDIGGATSSTLTFTAAGSQSGNVYRAVFTNAAGTANTTVATLTVNQISQTITVTSAAPAAAQIGGASYSPTATASSGLSVVTTIDASATSVCSIAGGVVSFQNAGTCTINFNQSGNATYLAAPQVQQSVVVAQSANTITFPALSDTSFTAAPPSPSATASSGLAVSYTSATTGVCTVTSGGAISFVSGGTCTITASQAGNSNYAAATPVDRSFAVLPGVNTITFAALPNRALGSGNFTLSASASSGLTVAFSSGTTGVCMVSGTTVSLLTVGTCTINANQSGNGSYQAAAQTSQSFQVTKAVTTVALTSSANSVFFGMPVTLTATVTGTTPTGTVTFSDGATVLGTAALTGNAATLTTSALPSGARQLTATYNGDANNLSATSSAVSVSVNARPDPALDPEVSGTISTQFNTVERFGRTQLDNIGGRLDQLHSDGEDQDALQVTLSQPRARMASNLPWEQGGQHNRSGYGYNTGQPGSASGTMLGSYDPIGLDAAPVQNAAGYAAAGSLTEPRVVHVWASGDVSFGKQQPNGLVETRFTSTGITAGMDGKVSDSLKLGVAMGFAWDHSRLGTMGSESDATNASLAFYGSLKAAPKTYIDLIVGTGFGTINSTRFSASGGILLDGKRRQRQTFAALIVTVEAKSGRLEIAPYLRADGIWVNLSPYTETGSPFWALAYQSASENSYSGTAGLRLRYPLDKAGRWLLTGKAEYRHRISGDYNQLLDYADIQGARGSAYVVTGQGVSDSTFTGGVGIEARLRTLSLRLNYDLTTMAGGNVANSVSGGIVIKF